MKFLILGNDPSLDLVNWDLVSTSSLFVVGINRSYMIYPDHDILFLQDPKTMLEILDCGYEDSELVDMNIHTTNYFKKRMVKEKSKKRKLDRITKQEYNDLSMLLDKKIIKTTNSVFKIKSHSPFSIPNAISHCFDFYNNEITDAGGATFYLYGCGLKHRENKNHFWQNSPDVRFPVGSPGGSSVKQLNRQLLVMNNLRPIFLAHKVNVVSCNVDSRLNNIFNHMSLSEVLLKNQKINNDQRNKL